MRTSSLAGLSDRFGTLISPAAAPRAWPAGDVIGLEHEYRVRIGSRLVDFRTVIHHLDLGRPRLDPADLNAYRLASGAVVTADETEAEIALAPGFVGPGCAEMLAATAASERRDLTLRIPGGVNLEGYSTHLSVAVQPSSAVALSKLYAASFSAAMMLLMDGASSPGLLIRPRSSRLELGGEFVEGDKLVVAAVFAIGSVRACQRWLDRGCRRTWFPDELSVRIDRDDQRYGWFVSRTAFGGDLYAGGRAARLQTRRRLVVTAQSHLEHCWAVARATLAEDLDARELDLVDRVVFGSAPLPAATPPVGEAGGGRVVDANVETWHSSGAGFGFAVRTHSRPGYDLAPVMLTWDRAVFVLSGPGRDRVAFANVPAPLLESFASELDGGALDEVFVSYLALSPRGRRLDRSATTARPGLYDLVAPRARLLVPERSPQVSARAQRRPVLRATRRGRLDTASLAGRRV